MTWRYTQAGKEISRPDSERGFCVEGPVTVDDWKGILEDIVVEMCEQAKREALIDSSMHRPPRAEY